MKFKQENTFWQIFLHFLIIYVGFPGGTSGVGPTWRCRRHEQRGVHPCVRDPPDDAGDMSRGGSIPEWGTHLTMQETWAEGGPSLCEEGPLEEGMLLPPGKNTCSGILAWKPHAQRSPLVHSPWGHNESDMTGRTYHTFCICICWTWIDFCVYLE